MIWPWWAALKENSFLLFPLLGFRSSGSRKWKRLEVDHYLAKKMFMYRLVCVCEDINGGSNYCDVIRSFLTNRETIMNLYLYRPSKTLISWSSTQVLVDHSGTFCAGGYPNVHFSFFLPGGCGGV